VSVWSWVRSGHLPSRTASRLIAPWLMRSSPVRVQEPAQPRLVLQGTGQLVALALRRPGIGAFDQVLQVGDQAPAHQAVPFSLLGVAADGEPPGPHPGIPARDPHLLDPQVPGHLVVTALAGQRRGGLTAGVPELLGVDAAPAALGEAGPVGRGGEPAAGDPHQPAQVPRSQVVLHPCG
jgi:hypothetical protein